VCIIFSSNDVAGNVSMKPVVVLVGRPNVGKSTLFNCLTRSRQALVADEPGVTRDRQYGHGVVGDRPYLVVDTGGLVESGVATPDRAMAEQVARQTRQAIREADTVLFVTDARAGLTTADQEIAAELRKINKPAWLVVNKCEGLDNHTAVAEFHALGLGDPQPVSAAHNAGLEALMSRVLTALPAVEEAVMPTDIPRIAVIGRPNAGKSTLVNALLGEERVLVSDIAGTTRDAIHIPFEREGHHFVLIDTAGVRRRSRVGEGIEKYSIIRTLHAIEEANVVILVFDAEAGISEQDATLAGYALDQGRAMVLVVNKWDALDAHARSWAKRELERKLPFLSFAPVHFVSALSGTGLEPIFRSCEEAFAASGCTLPTSRLNRVLERAMAANAPPVSRGRRIRPKFAHQVGRYPPTIVVRGNLVSLLPENYRRYLANTFRQEFRLSGSPIRIIWETEKNPYAGKGRQRTSKGKKSRPRSKIKK
jgi:GTP-binding protein